MHWLLEMLLEVAITLNPWSSKHVDRSVVGDSPFDRSARKVAIVCAVIAILFLGGLFYLRR